MPEFLKLIPPDDAKRLLLQNIPANGLVSEIIETVHALGRVIAQDIIAPHPLPTFPRSTVDGFAVYSDDTFSASDSQPVYLSLVSEVPMGTAPSFKLAPAQAASIHTGGMVPDGADAVIMLEYTQTVSEREIEILRPVAVGENVIKIGEDVEAGQAVIPQGRLIRPEEIGGLMALGLTHVQVVKKPCVGIISCGDEVVSPDKLPEVGQVRDINSYSLAALIDKAGGESIQYGIVPDESESLIKIARRALIECEFVVITAGSSVSARDITATVIASLGKPGVLVHGVNVRPGKPTILAVCDGKPVFGLPGNPVSALVIARLFVIPVIDHLLGLPTDRLHPSVTAKLTTNLPSQAGQEDWIAIRLVNSPQGRMAEPIFGKSNLIFNLCEANGLLRIPANSTGMSAGDAVEVLLQ